MDLFLNLFTLDFFGGGSSGSAGCSAFVWSYHSSLDGHQLAHTPAFHSSQSSSVHPWAFDTLDLGHLWLKQRMIKQMNTSYLSHTAKDAPNKNLQNMEATIAEETSKCISSSKHKVLDNISFQSCAYGNNSGKEKMKALLLITWQYKVTHESWKHSVLMTWLNNKSHISESWKQLVLMTWQQQVSHESWKQLVLEYTWKHCMLMTWKQQMLEYMWKH